MSFSSNNQYKYQYNLTNFYFDVFIGELVELDKKVEQDGDITWFMNVAMDTGSTVTRVP